MTNFTTIEKLALNASPSYDCIVRYNGYVCHAKMNYKGTYDAEVYEFIDSTEDFAEIECRLSLIEKANGNFATSGDAVKWCFDYIESL